jgi:hypothetical protein
VSDPEWNPSVILTKRVGRVLCVHDKKLLFSMSQHPVHNDLATFNSQDGTCPSVDEPTFGSGPICEDTDDFALSTSPDDWLESLHPVRQRGHVRFLQRLTTTADVLKSRPRDRENDEVCLLVKQDISCKVMEAAKCQFHYEKSGRSESEYTASGYL